MLKQVQHDNRERIMKRKTSFLPAFLIVLFLSFLFLILSFSGTLKIFSFLEKPTSVMQSFSYNLFQKLPFVSKDLKTKRLKEENLALLSRVADFEKLKKENSALSDQFQTSYPPNYKLLKADIIGAPSFVPGISNPSVFILNKGARNNIKVGFAVVIKNNLVGVIAKTTQNLSQVNLINSFSESFTAKTENGAVGIVKGGEGLTINNILLSENIKEGEIVLTKGDMGMDGVGIIPDLVIGKITEIEKNPSDLFQKAKIESFVDFGSLSTVFIYMQDK